MTSLLIKSVDRVGGSSHNMVYDAGRVVEGSFLVKHVFVPNTCYNVNSYNNQFQLTLDGIAFTTVSLTEGNYTSATLAVELVLQCDAVATAFTATISTISGKLILSKNSSFGLRFPNPKVALMLGFDGTDTGLSASHTGSKVVHLNYAVSIGVQIDSVINTNYENGATQIGGAIYVPMNLSFGFYKSLPSGDYNQVVKFNRCRHMRIQLVDTTDGTLIDLNGGEYEVLLAKC